MTNTKVPIEGASFEIIFKVGGYLYPYELSMLIQTSRHFRDILQESLNKIGTTGFPELSALNWACQMGHLPLVGLVLARGSPINGTTEETPPIIIAAENNQDHIVRYLLQRGADPDAMNNFDEDCFDIALQYDYINVVRVLIDMGVDINANVPNPPGSRLVVFADARPPLDRIVRTNRIRASLQAIQLLLDRGAEVNTVESGISMLHWLAKNESHGIGYAYGSTSLSMAIAPLLLSAGIDINATDHNKGYTALHYAAALPNTDFMALLLNWGADVNASDYWGRTPIYNAIAEDSFNSVDLLLRSGAILDITDYAPHDSFSPISMACQASKNIRDILNLVKSNNGYPYTTEEEDEVDEESEDEAEGKGKGESKNAIEVDVETHIQAQSGGEDKDEGEDGDGNDDNDDGEDSDNEEDYGDSDNGYDEYENSSDGDYEYGSEGSKEEN